MESNATRDDSWKKGSVTPSAVKLAKQDMVRRTGQSAKENHEQASETQPLAQKMNTY